MPMVIAPLDQQKVFDEFLPYMGMAAGSVA